ncbi:MAG: hypothetical protein JNN07_24110 [Verrucomicrobiales bacterium]|nr:hypothetical protein [Verrucomicrobiales bacterium]
MKTPLFSLVCSAALLFSGCASSSSHSAAFEYKVLEVYSAKSLEQKLNTLSREGWVFVSSSQEKEGGNVKTTVILKKAIQ